MDETGNLYPLSDKQDFILPPWAARLIRKVDMAQDGYQIERDHVLYLEERELPS